MQSRQPAHRYCWSLRYFRESPGAALPGPGVSCAGASMRGHRATTNSYVRRHPSLTGTGKAISGSRCQRQNDMLDAGMITRSCPTLTYRSSGAGLTARGATLAGVRRVIFFEPDQTPFASVAKTPEVTARSSLRSRDNRLEPPETRFSVHWKVQQITEAPKFFPQNRVRWLIGPVLRNKIERALSQFLARMKAVNLSNPNKFEP